MGRRNKIFDGVTVDDSTASYAYSLINYDTTFIYIKNNHGSNSIQYQVTGYADYRDPIDSAHILQTWLSLASGNTSILKTTDPWDVIKIEVKNASVGDDSSAVIWVNSGGYHRG